MNAPSQSAWSSRLRRGCGVLAGVGVHVLFAWTVVRVFLFLQNGAPVRGAFSPGRDVLLALWFAIPHSLLLWPPMGRWIKRALPAEFYGLLFCAVTSVTLLVLIGNWSASETALWELQGFGRRLVQGLFLGSWVAMFYSMSLTGLGFQTGWTQWRHWWLRRPLPRREFTPRGAYLWIRHPVYLSFLGLIWFTPRMTWDHVVLTLVWTAYIFVGSHLKDERMAHFLGEQYRRYQETAPGFPGFPRRARGAPAARVEPSPGGSRGANASASSEFDRITA